jgi:hypothetical protein
LIIGFNYEWLADRCDYDAAELRRACVESVSRKKAAIAAR